MHVRASHAQAISDKRYLCRHTVMGRAMVPHLDDCMLTPQYAPAHWIIQQRTVHEHLPLDEQQQQHVRAVSAQHGDPAPEANGTSAGVTSDGSRAHGAAARSHALTSQCCTSAAPEPGMAGRCKVNAEKFGACDSGPWAAWMRRECPVACGNCTICSRHPLFSNYMLLYGGAFGG